VDLRPLVVVDPRRPPTTEALDQALRAAASLCVHLAITAGCSLLLPGDHRASDIEPDLRSWPPLHARLALVEPDAAAPVGGRIERAGAVFWVSAGALAPPPGIARAAPPPPRPLGRPPRRPRPRLRRAQLVRVAVRRGRPVGAPDPPARDAAPDRPGGDSRVLARTQARGRHALARARPAARGLRHRHDAAWPLRVGAARLGAA